MNRSYSVFASLALLATAAVAQAALSPVGTWHGKMVATFTPPAQPPAAQGQAPADTSAVKKKVETDLGKVRITIVVKKDGTYSATSTQANGSTLKTTGKWKLKGHTLTMQPDPEKPLPALRSVPSQSSFAPDDSKAKHTDPPRIGTISANGKKMVVPIPPGLAAMGVHGQIVFTKG